MSLERIGVCEIDRVWLVYIFGHIAQMETQGLAEATELDFAGMFQAELESLSSNLLEI